MGHPEWAIQYETRTQVQNEINRSAWKPFTKPTMEVIIVNIPTDNVKASIW